MSTDLKTRPTNKHDTKYANRLNDVLQAASDGDIVQTRQNASDYLDEQQDAAETHPKLWAAVKTDILNLKDDEGNLSVQMICQAGYTIQTRSTFPIITVTLFRQAG